MSSPKPVTVLITGAAGQIGYALAPQVCRGAMLGPDVPVILHLLDIPPAETALGGVAMELVDAAYPLVKGIVATVDVDEACKGVDVAVMVGGFPRGPGMERKEVMGKNVAIYKHQAGALEKHAAPGCKVVVVANPANTNALILSTYAPKIPKENVTCLTRLDHNRALGQVSQRVGVPVSEVKNVIIWGNHSSTQYPDVNHGEAGSGRSIRDAVKDDEYLNGEFVKTVQQRGAAIIAARKLSSALSAASSVCDHVRDWINGTPKGTWTSMGVVSPGAERTASKRGSCTFPVTCEGEVEHRPGARDRRQVQEAHGRHRGRAQGGEADGRGAHRRRRGRVMMRAFRRERTPEPSRAHDLFAVGKKNTDTFRVRKGALLKRERGGESDLDAVLDPVPLLRPRRLNVVHLDVPHGEWEHQPDPDARPHRLRVASE